MSHCLLLAMSRFSITYFIFLLIISIFYLFFFFFNDTATTEIYTLSLHDALPILDSRLSDDLRSEKDLLAAAQQSFQPADLDRKSTRLNSSHANISYAVFCLKKKNLHRIYCQQKIELPLILKPNVAKRSSDVRLIR